MSDEILSYRDLKVWQEAMALTEVAYVLTKQFPKEETYGLASQTQRAAVSVPANIAEGHGRRSRKEFFHHLSIARGSLAELETHMTLAHRFRYITDENHESFWRGAQQLGRRLNSLLRALARDAG